MYSLEKYHLRCAAVTGLAIGAVSAGYTIYQGEQKKKQAEEAMANLETPELENVFTDMPVSTLGSDIAREEASRNTASLVNASRQAGTRGVFSSIPRIQSLNNEANRRNQLELDTRIDRRNELVARDNQRIQGIDENRYNQELAGIGQLMDVGDAQTMSGVRGLGNSLVSGENQMERGQRTNDSELPYDFGISDPFATSMPVLDASYDSYVASQRQQNNYNSFAPSPYRL